jgi:DNA-binding transcriptional LysR family regulator
VPEAASTLMDAERTVGEWTSQPLRRAGPIRTSFSKAHGISAQVRFRNHDNETEVGLVAAGMGAALVPRLTVDPARDDVVQLEIAAGLPARLIALV